LIVTEGEKAAQAARHRYGLTLQKPVPDILRLIEVEAQVPVAIIRLEGDEFDGAYRRDRGSGFILINGSHSVVRQRFTLAHELGHHELKDKAALDRKIDWSTKDQREVAANWFAAEFLAPRDAVRQWADANADNLHEDRLIDLILLAAQFGISCPVALYRLKAAGAHVGPREFTKLELRIKTQEHLSVQRGLYLPPFRDSLSELQRTWTGKVRVPQQTMQDILGAVVEGVIDKRTAAERLMVPEKQLTALLADRELGE
jgi:Zn-dependent peptidase ImmA (M78 family)